MDGTETRARDSVKALVIADYYDAEYDDTKFNLKKWHLAK